MKFKYRLLIALLLSISILGTSCQKQKDYSPQINALQARIDSLAAALMATNSNLQATNNNVNGLISSIAAIQAQLSLIVGQISALNTQLTETSNTVSGQSNAISNIQSQLAVIVGQIATLNTQMTASNNTVGVISTSLTAIQSKLSGLLNQIDILNSQQTVTNANIANINAQLLASNSQLNNLQQEFDILVSELGMVIDIAGNVYHTVTIGTQVWMVENLKTTKYRNGDQVPQITDGSAWAALTSGAYCWYNNDSTTNKDIYGALYNWYVVNDSRNIAPIGWHVPTDVEWTILTNYLGGETLAGGELKETGTSHWSSPNTGATNSSGFLALPGGSRYYTNGVYYYISLHGRWWSTTEGDASDAWLRELYYTNPIVVRNNSPKQLGISVRCVRD